MKHRGEFLEPQVRLQQSRNRLANPKRAAEHFVLGGVKHDHLSESGFEVSWKSSSSLALQVPQREVSGVRQSVRMEGSTSEKHVRDN